MTRSLSSVVPSRRGHACAYGLLALAFNVVLIRDVSAQRIFTEFDHAADFSTYKTFAIVSSTLRSPNPALNSELTKKRVDEALERAFLSRGLSKVTANPDLSISYTLGSPGRLETVSYPASGRGRPTKVSTPVVEGHLIIDVRDEASRTPIWRGVATDDEPDAAKVAEKLDKIVDKLIARYPSRKK